MPWVCNCLNDRTLERNKNLGNLTLKSTALLAGTETRHDFLVQDHLLQWSSLRTPRKRHNLVQQQFILHCIVNVEDVIEKRLQCSLLI